MQASAEETGSGFREIVIMDTKERSIERFDDRGAREDVTWHGQIKAIVEQGGGSQLLETMYDGLVRGLQKRPAATLIHSTHGAIEDTYAKLGERACPRTSPAAVIAGRAPSVPVLDIVQAGTLRHHGFERAGLRYRSFSFTGAGTTALFILPASLWAHEAGRGQFGSALIKRRLLVSTLASLVAEVGGAERRTAG